jgi:hypothetical protein
MKKFRILLASFALVFGLGALTPVVASAATAKSTVCDSLGSDTSCNSVPGGGVSVNKVITVIVNTLSFVVGVGSVIMIMVGGFKMVTSGGDSNKVASGRSTILYAIIGIVVVVFSQAIVYFVLHKLK